uniref:Transposase Tc1-like domain-containing protein n=1 Tax=Anguilla anguilla TaxID=7936 RepID=A0A0E9QAW3_ANGAN
MLKPPKTMTGNTLQEAGLDVSVTTVHRKLHLKEPAEFWKQVLWTDETKIHKIHSE